MTDPTPQAMRPAWAGKARAVLTIQLDVEADTYQGETDDEITSRLIEALRKRTFVEDGAFFRVRGVESIDDTTEWAP